MAERTEARVRTELAEVERHMAEVPPHHGGGRSDLAARADALRRELTRLREAARRDEAD